MKEMKPLTMGRRFRIWLDGVKWRWRNGGALGVAERRLARRTEQVEVLKKRVKELMVRAAEAQAMAEMERSRRVQVEEWLAEKVQIIEWKKDTVERLRSQIEELTRVGGGGGEGLGTEDWGLSGSGGGGDR